MLCYSFSIITFIIIIHYILLPFSNAIPSIDDNMLIAFIKGPKEIQISEYSVQKYEAHFGILYFMRTNWKCDKIHEKFEEYERTKCQKYRKYLDILYEYLYREYAGILTVKPKFVFKIDQLEIEGPIIYAVNCLTRISDYFHASRVFYNNLNIFNSLILKPKLLNEERLNYLNNYENELLKMPIDEMILQLAIDTANQWQTNESLDGIIKQNFDKNMKEAKKEKPLKAFFDKYELILYSKFDDQLNWTEDALFSEFVKGQATNLEKFSKFFKDYSELNKYSTKYKSNLCAVYLMNFDKFHCNKFCKAKKDNCRKYRKHSHILYEYLFQLYAEAKSPELSIQLLQIKPKFNNGKHLSLIDVVTNLYYGKFCCEEKYGRIEKNYAMELLNEEEFNYEEINEEENGENEKQILNEPTKIEIMRKEFEQKMKKMC